MRTSGLCVTLAPGRLEPGRSPPLRLSGLGRGLKRRGLQGKRMGLLNCEAGLPGDEGGASQTGAGLLKLQGKAS